MEFAILAKFAFAFAGWLPPVQLRNTPTLDCHHHMTTTLPNILSTKIVLSSNAY